MGNYCPGLIAHQVPDCQISIAHQLHEYQTLVGHPVHEFSNAPVGAIRATIDFEAHTSPGAQGSFNTLLSFIRMGSGEE